MCYKANTKWSDCFCTVLGVFLEPFKMTNVSTGGCSWQREAEGQEGWGCHEGFPSKGAGELNWAQIFLNKSLKSKVPATRSLENRDSHVEHLESTEGHPKFLHFVKMLPRAIKRSRLEETERPRIQEAFKIYTEIPTTTVMLNPICSNQGPPEGIQTSQIIHLNISAEQKSQHKMVKFILLFK